MTKRSIRIAALSLALGVVFVSEDFSLGLPGVFTSQAEAVIGRPLTPLSYAGVARRTTRRAVGRGYAAGVAVATAPVVVVPACVQAVDAYGNVYTRCP